MRAGNDAKLTGVSPSTATTLLDTTVTDELTFTGDITHSGAQSFIGVVAIGLPGTMRVDSSTGELRGAGAVPALDARAEEGGPHARDQRRASGRQRGPGRSGLYPAGATRVWIKLTYLAGPVLMNAYVKAGTSTTGLVGFALSDISVPRYAQHWRTEDSQDLWIPVDIVNPKTAVGSRFKVSFNGEGIAGAVGTSRDQGGRGQRTAG